ncbi:MAG: thermonuclease family protein [Parvibaculum sp.]
MLSCLLSGALAQPVWAAGAVLQDQAAVQCGLKAGERFAVTEIVDGDTVVLETGRQVRLVGLQAPKLALGRRNYKEWPLAEEARDALADLVLGQAVTLHYGGRKEDRHGRILAHLILDDGRWVQRDMLALGYARVYSFPDNRACVPELLKSEIIARAEGRGIWPLDYYALQPADTPDALLRAVDSFQLVEGQIARVARVRNRIFINFGENWRDDFTLVIEGADRRRFPDDLDGWAGRTVRVRGWISSYNGPEIELTHPEQIEWLDAPPS